MTGSRIVPEWDPLDPEDLTTSTGVPYLESGDIETFHRQQARQGYRGYPGRSVETAGVEFCYLVLPGGAIIYGGAYVRDHNR